MKFSFDHYSDGDSALHRWDARWKTAGILLFVFCAAVVQTIPAASAALAVGAALLLFAQLPPRLMLHRLGAIHIILIPCFFIVPLTAGGESVQWMGLGWSWEGLRYAWLIYLRALAMVCASLALMHSTPLPRMLAAGERLKIPRPFIQIAMLSFRYLFSLSREMGQVKNALRARGFQNQTSLRCYKTLANIIGITLIRSFERTDRIYAAMRCRGYAGTMRILHPFAARPLDWALFGILLSAAIAIIAVDWAL